MTKALLRSITFVVGVLRLEDGGVVAYGDDLSAGYGDGCDLSGRDGFVGGLEVGAGEDVAACVDGVRGGLLLGREREGGEEECGDDQAHGWTVTQVAEGSPAMWNW